MSNISVTETTYPAGSLASIIKAAGTRLFSSGEILKLFYGVCQAIKHLHSFNPCVIHRDIKVSHLRAEKEEILGELWFTTSIKIVQFCFCPISLLLFITVAIVSAPGRERYTFITGDSEDM